MKMHAQRRGEQTQRRKRRDDDDVEGVLAGLSAFSSILAFSLLFFVGVCLLSFISVSSSLSLLVFWSLSSLFSSVSSFFWYSFVPPPRLCVFLFFTLYPFSFASSPLCFFFSLLLLVFLATLLSRVLCVFPLLSLSLLFSSLLWSAQEAYIQPIQQLYL